MPCPRATPALRTSSLRTAAPALALLAALLHGLGCAATTVRSSWEREDYTGGPIGSLLVMGVSPHAGGRALYEHRLARELAAHGVRALEASEALEERPEVTPAQVRAWSRQLGVAGVLTTHLVDVRHEIDVVPPTWHPMLWEPYGYWGFGYGGAWHGYYGMGVYGYPGPWAGGVRESRIVVLETNLYDAGGRLIWSAVTETFNPGSRETVVDEVASQVTRELAAHDLVPAERTARAEPEGDGAADLPLPGD